jgi:hypothetical protein
VQDRSIRVPMIIALIAGLVMVAVPLYLWRKPNPRANMQKLDAETNSEADKNFPSGIHRFDAGLSQLSKGGSPNSPSAAGLNSQLNLADPKVYKCTKAGRGKTPPEQCDHLPALEQALIHAIRTNPSCVPKISATGTINFVMNVDFKHKKLRVWPGQSGSIHGKKAKGATRCIQHAMAAPDWAQPHQHIKYQITMLVTYPVLPAMTAP